MTRDPREAYQFITKKEAVIAIKAIGWQVNDARRVDIMGFLPWVIADEHGGMLTKAEFNSLLAGVVERIVEAQS